ncbi:TPA: hypothetical protein ACSP1W_002431 [Aeromonas veronii]
MGQGVKRTQRDYSLTFKLALVELSPGAGEVMTCWLIWETTPGEGVNHIQDGTSLAKKAVSCD